MPTESAGRKRLSVNRSLVLELVHFSRQVPLFPVERPFDLANVAAARASLPLRISWAVIFLKAYALVAARTPELRQAYQWFPWPHLLQFAHNVGMVAINREYEGEPRVCFARFIRPENMSLVELQAELNRYKSGPVETTFRRQLTGSRLPFPLRRMLMWCGLNLSGQRRAKRMGTFGMSTLAGLGALNRFHPTFLTTSLTYGPVDDDGRALVTLICDHRVLDGVLAAQSLIELERVIEGEIADELAELAARQHAA